MTLGLILAINSIYSQNLQLEENWWQPNGIVNAVAFDSTNNLVYLGGGFSAIGPDEAYGSQIDAITGLPNMEFANPNENVVATVSDGNGGWYIGGNFTMVGDSSRNYLAHINNLGNVTSWNPNANGAIVKLSLSGAILYAGGNFTTIGGQSRNFIASLHTSNGLATSWNPNANGSVFSLVVSDSLVYVGGSFTIISGQTRNRIAAISINTGLATTWDPNLSSQVNSLAVQGDIIFAASGSWIYALGSAPGSSYWTISTNAIVRCLTASATTLFAGGDFSIIGGVSRHGLAAINNTTGIITSWNPNTGFGNEWFYSISVADSTVYVGGYFSSIGGQPRNNIAALDTITGLATNWNPNAGLGGTVNSISVAGSAVYVGGSFSSIGMVTRNGIAALDATSGIPTTWNPNANLGAGISSIAPADSVVFVGGNFTSIGGGMRNGIAALHATTGLITSWDPQTSISNYVYPYSIVVLGSTVYVGGEFDSLGGQPRNNIAALDIITGNATSWNPNSNGPVRTIVVSDSIVYIGGNYSSIGGQPRVCIAAINKSTGNATSWNPSVSNLIVSMALTGTNLYIGGSFNTIGGQYRSGLGAISTLTGLATSWDPDPNNYVLSLSTSGTTLYVGGNFSYFGSTSNPVIRNRLASFDITTGNFTSWNPDVSPSSTDMVLSIAASDSKVFVGGHFSSIGGIDRNSFAGFSDCDPSDGTDVQSACNSYTWIDGNTYTSSNNSATWTLTNSLGCDSVVTLHLTMNNSNTGIDIITACDSYIWMDGVTYTSSNNTATYTLTNAAGCDSVVTLHLTMNNSNSGIDIITACDSYIWMDGVTYTSSNNTATYTLTNAAGCDSVVTLHLTMNNSNTGVDVITACDSYMWIDGVTYTSSNNTATYTLTNATGCDSVVTLHLTINTVDTMVISDGYSLTANANAISYLWIDCITNSIINGETNQVYIPTINGSYAVIIMQNGCTDTSACYNITTIGIVEHSSSKINIYPNPSQSIVNIDLGEAFGKVNLIVRNQLGQIVLNSSFRNINKTSLDLNGLLKGSYFLEVITEKESITFNLIKI